MAQALIAQLGELRLVVLERLLTTPLEVLQRREYLEDVQDNTAYIDTTFDNVQQNFTELAAEAEQQVSSSVSSSQDSTSRFALYILH